MGETHTHESIAGTDCDGCPSLHVRDNARYRHRKPEFYCERRGK